MTINADLIKKDVVSYLKEQENKTLLRFITCGSVDDGKSTLIGRLLYDAHLLFDDQIKTLEQSSRNSDFEEKIDFAMLVDGLAAEQEQGITIDVAYRYFSTQKRKYIVADTPGHEQYTRNMATGASTANLAVILVDAKNGISVQTRRHSYIVSLLGIKSIIVAINKMDAVEYSENIFNEIKNKFLLFSEKLDFDEIFVIPISALKGDNIKNHSTNMDWYKGPSLLQHLDSVEVSQANQKEFCMPVQLIARPDSNFRGYCGTIAAGNITCGEEIVVMPSGYKSRIKEIVTYEGNYESATTNQAVTLTLEDEIDISRGDLICNTINPAQISDHIQAQILWMSDQEMLPGRDYLLKTINKTVPANISKLKHKINVNTLDKEAANTLKQNEIGVCNIALGSPIAFYPYAQQRQTGGFIIIDRLSNETVGMGLIKFSLTRASNIVWQDLEISINERAKQKHQKPAVLWFTGLSGSGKSTIANLVEQKLFEMGRHTYILDGDNIRHGLNKDLGFTDADRVENIRRISETAKLMADAGLIVLVSFISPFSSDRDRARRIMKNIKFIEIYINTPLEVVEARDIKGLYAKARKGEIKNFTGIDSEYQEPTNPEITINTVEMSAEEAAMKVVKYLKTNNILGLD